MNQTEEAESSAFQKSRVGRRRADTTLIFDPAQLVPGPVLDAILEE
jgi:hypothetical protein